MSHPDGTWAGPLRTRSGVLPGTRTPSIKVSSSSRRKVPQAGGYSLRDSLRTCRSHTGRQHEKSGDATQAPDPSLLPHRALHTHPHP